MFLSGVEIAATAFSNLLANDYVKPIESRDYLLTIFTWGILVGLICRMMNTLAAALCVAVLSFFYLFAAKYQFQSDALWYPIIVPLFLQSPAAFFGAVLWNLLETNKERRNIRRALGYYVPSEMVDLIVKNRVDLRKGGQTVCGVCLFTDIGGYTSVSENLGPRELSELMHRYFEAVFEPIKQNGGLITDLKGDSILAIWKAPRPDMRYVSKRVRLPSALPTPSASLTKRPARNFPPVSVFMPGRCFSATLVLEIITSTVLQGTQSIPPPDWTISIKCWARKSLSPKKPFEALKVSLPEKSEIFG